MSTPLLLSITEAAALLGLTKPQLYQLLRSRSSVKVPHIRLGKRVLFKRESLERWLESLEVRG